MESKNRNVGIVVAAAAVVLLCSCALLAGAGVVGVLASSSSSCCGQDRSHQERVTESFAVGSAPVLEIDNFAGSVTVSPGSSGLIQVAATKKTASHKDLHRIDISMAEQDGGLAIEVKGPPTMRNASVHLEITAPADTRLDLALGAGNVRVRGLYGGVQARVGAGNHEISDVGGELKVSTGAGTISVHGAKGPVHLQNGAGVITYQGTPQGISRFESGAGAIALTLPADPNVTVDLSTEVGAIDVACPVDGLVRKREVKGTIGSGDQGKLRASSGLGGIGLTCR